MGLGLEDDMGNWSTTFLNIMKPVCSWDFGSHFYPNSSHCIQLGWVRTWKDLFHIGGVNTRKELSSRASWSSASGVLILFWYIPVARITWLCLCFPTYKSRQWYLPVLWSMPQNTGKTSCKRSSKSYSRLENLKQKTHYIIQVRGNIRPKITDNKTWEI